MNVSVEKDKSRSSSFITYLGQWFRGRQTPAYILVPPSNHPLHLPPPSQFVFLALATVHPRLAIQKQQSLCSIGGRLAPLTRRDAYEPFPFVFGISHRTYQLPTSFRSDSNATEQLCRVPPTQRDWFSRSNSARPPSLPPRHTCRFTLVLLQPDVLPKNHLAPVSADPTQTTAHRLHAPDHKRSNGANVLGSRLFRRRSQPGDVPDGLEDSSHSLHPVGLASSTTSPIYPRHSPLFPWPLGNTPPSPPPPWRSQCLGDTIRSPPHLLFGDDHWGTATAPPTYSSTPTFGEQQTLPRHRRPFGDINRFPSHGMVNSPFDKRWSPYHLLFAVTLAQTIPPLPGHQRHLPASFSVYQPAYPGQRRIFRTSPITTNTRFIAPDPAL